MAIGTPVAIVGTSPGNANSGMAEATTTTVAAPVGALVFLSIGNVNNNANITAFSDSASNHWTIVQNAATANANNDAICWTIVSTNMPVGTSFTASTTAGQWNINGGWKILGCNSGIDTVQKGVLANNSTGVSQATGTLATDAGELIIGQIVTYDAVTVTEAANFTNLWNDPNGAVDYRIVSGSGSITWAPSWTIDTNHTGWILLSFKISAVGIATGVGAASAIGVAGSSQPAIGTATGTGAAPGFALASGTGTAAGTAVVQATGAAATAVVALAAGATTAPALSTNTGVGLAAGTATALAIGAPQGVGTALAIGLGAAPGIGLATIPVPKKVVGWFDEWDLPPPPIKRQRLMAIQRVQRNNGWLNAGRIFKSLNKSTKRMRRDQNFRYEDEEEDARG